MTDKILASLKQMALQRAKGELKSILSLFWENDGEYEKYKFILNDFIEKVEGESTWL